LKDDGEVFARGDAYCQISLVEMRLAKGVEYFTKRYPVVHTTIGFIHGNQETVIPYLAGPGFLKELSRDNLDRIINRNHLLTPLFPFNRGEVKLQAGLFSTKASDPIEKFINTLGRFSDLISVPELSKVSSFAKPVLQGIEDLLGVGEGRLELGYHQTFTEVKGGGSNILRSGYFVAILAEADEIKEETLCVINDELCVGRAGEGKEFLSNHKSFNGYSYMLFRITRRTDQDWESLTEIQNLVYEAHELLVKGLAKPNVISKVKEKLIPHIKITIFRSPDIATKDKRAMVVRIEDELRQYGLESRCGKHVKPSLRKIMRRPMPDIRPEMQEELDELEMLFCN
jgi:hypothetical protein